MERVVSVGLGELAISNERDVVLVAFGLGSCVGVMAFDPVVKLGGLLHAMLPMHRNGDRNVTKFVDTGIAELLDQMLSRGGKRERLIWRMAGGAQMLTAPGLTDRFNIGMQNVTMANDVMARQSLRLTGQDTGGYQGRTVQLFVADGRVVVRNINGEKHCL